MKSISISTPSRTLFAVPYWIAAKNGYFADEGLSPSLQIIGDITMLKARLRAGEDHLSIDTPDGIILDAMSGGPLRIVAGNACRPPLFIIAQPHILTLQQLRGATFGVLSLKEGSSKLISKIAQAAGLSVSDFNIVEIGGAPARKQLLLEGKIDVGLQPMPLNFEAEAAGLNSLGWTGTFEPDWQFTTINTNIEWASANPSLAIGALRALKRALHFMQASSTDAALLVADELRTEPAFAERAIVEALRLGILDLQLKCSNAGLAKIVDNLRSDGFGLATEEALRVSVDPRFHERASI